MLLRVRDPKTSTTGSRNVRKLPGLLPIQSTGPSTTSMNERLIIVPDNQNVHNTNHTSPKTTEPVIDLSDNQTSNSAFVNQAQFETIDNCNRLNMHGRSNGLPLNSSHAFTSSSVSTKIPSENYKEIRGSQALRSRRLLETPANQFAHQTNANGQQNIGWDRYSFKNGWPSTKASQQNVWCDVSQPVVKINPKTANTERQIFQDHYFETEINTSQPPPYKRPCLFERKVNPSRSKSVTPVTSHPLFNTINAVIRQEILKALETIAQSATKNVIRELEATAVTVTSQTNLQRNLDFNAKNCGQQSMVNCDQNDVFEIPQNISISPTTLQKNGYYTLPTVETNSRISHRIEASRKCRPTPEQTEALSLVTCVPPSSNLPGLCPATQEEAVNLTRPRINISSFDAPVDLSKASSKLHLSTQRSFSVPNGEPSKHSHDVSRSILHSTSGVSPVSPLVYKQIGPLSCIGADINQTEIRTSPLEDYVDHSPLDSQDDLDRYNAYNPDDDISYCPESNDSTPSNIVQEEALTPQHLKKAKLMFFYARYPNTRSLKLFFSDVKFTRATTSQLIKWFSNFREFYYIQVERFARQALTDGITDANQLQVSRDSEVFRVLNLHYNKGNDFVVPSGFDETARITLCEFFAAIQAGKDRGPSWKKAIYKVIAKLDQEVPPFFKAPTM